MNKCQFLKIKMISMTNTNSKCVTKDGCTFWLSGQIFKRKLNYHSCIAVPISSLTLNFNWDHQLQMILFNHDPVVWFAFNYCLNRTTKSFPLCSTNVFYYFPKGTVLNFPNLVKCWYWKPNVYKTSKSKCFNIYFKGSQFPVKATYFP